MLDAGIVSGGDGFGTDLFGHVEELIELDEVIADGARNRRASGDVVGDERRDDLLLEAIFEVDYVEGDANGLRDAAGTAASGGAALGDEVGDALLVPQLHGHADDGPLLGMEQRCDDGAIDSAAHGYCDEFFRHGLTGRRR